MMILNQDKDMLVNIDNSMAVCIMDNGEDKDRAIAISFGIDGNVILGRYKTAERTKEVLSEIYGKMKKNGIYFTYEMPKE